MRTYLREYFLKNSTEFLKLIIILAITVLVSILVINNTTDSQKAQIKEFVDTRISEIKNGDYTSQNSTFNHTFLYRLKEFWLVSLLASSLVGLPIAYFVIVKRIFSIGYTISAIFATQSTRTSIIFICNMMLFHNIMYISSLFIVLVSGIRFIKNILKKDRNLKFEILRFLIFVFIGLVIVLVSTLFETYISVNLLNLFKKYL